MIIQNGNGGKDVQEIIKILPTDVQETDEDSHEKIKKMWIILLLISLWLNAKLFMGIIEIVKVLN